MNILTILSKLKAAEEAAVAAVTAVDSTDHQSALTAVKMAATHVESILKGQLAPGNSPLAAPNAGSGGPPPIPAS